MSGGFLANLDDFHSSFQIVWIVFWIFFLVSYSVFASFSLCFQFVTVFSVSHCVFRFYVASGGTITTVTKFTTVSTANFICILWHYFVLSKYL